ncbi:hypothetical protein ES703_118318 [subsurface metagenome]
MITSLKGRLGYSLIANLVATPVVPAHPKNSPERSGRGDRENQYGEVEHDPMRTISPVGRTTSNPFSMSV